MISPISYAVFFCAGLVQGLTGFGFSLVAVPILVHFLDPKIMTPIILLHSAVLNILVLTEAKSGIKLQRIWPLMAAGFVGTPVGVYALATLKASALKIIIGVAIMVFTAVLLSGYRFKIKNEFALSFPVGFLSGVLNGSTTMSGPPVLLFFSNQTLPKTTFRANLAAYFLFLNLVAIPSLLWRRLLSGAVLQSAALLLPAMFCGALAGIFAARRVNESAFKKVVLWLLFMSGILAIVMGFETH